MHNQQQNSDGSTRFVDAEKSIEALRLNNGGAEFYGISFAVGIEGAGAADRIDTVIQLTGRGGKAVAKQLTLLIYCSLDDGAKLLTGTTWTAVAGLKLAAPTNVPIPWELGSNGSVTAGITLAGANTRLIHVILPDGRMIQSPVLTFA